MREYQKIIIRGVQNKPQLTTDMLNLLTPLYKQGYEAGEQLLKNHKTLDEHTVHHLSSLVELKEMTLARIVEYGYPLMVQELKKLGNNSTLNLSQDVFYIVFFEGVHGLEKGLLKYEPNKTVSVSYIMSWFTTYAERELLRLETPAGVAPTRYQTLKKIYAVRTKLQHLLQREPTHEEVLEFFHSGQADQQSKRGKKTNGASRANQNITLADVYEQHEVTTSLTTSIPINPTETKNVLNTPHDNNNQELSPQTEIIMGYIREHVHNIKPDALTTLLYHLGYDVNTALISNRTLASLWKTWEEFLTAPNTTFQTYLQETCQVPPRTSDDQKVVSAKFDKLFKDTTLILCNKAQP